MRTAEGNSKTRRNFNFSQLQKSLALASISPIEAQNSRMMLYYMSLHSDVNNKSKNPNPNILFSLLPPLP